jgi:hypothetical protein
MDCLSHAALPRRPNVGALSTILGALLLAAAGAVRAADPPLRVGDLQDLMLAGVAEPVISTMLDARGFQGPLGVPEVIALTRARLSEEMLLRLFALLGADPEALGVTVAEEDGVVVISGQGVPEAEGSWLDPSEPAPAPQPMRHEDEDWPEQEPRWAPSLPPTTPVVVNAYPTGAVFGPTGGAVFIPAHQGNPPSSFGRTIVHAGGYAVAACTPYPTSAAWAPVAVETAPLQPEPRRYRRIVVHTSRGPLSVPN